MKKIIVMLALLASCQNVKKETITCKIKEIKNVQQSTLQDFDPRYVIVTDCGWAASTKKRGLKVGDTVSFRVPVK